MFDRLKMALCICLTTVAIGLAPSAAKAVSVSAWSFTGPGIKTQNSTAQSASFSYDRTVGPRSRATFSTNLWAVEATFSGTGQIELDWDYTWNHAWYRAGAALLLTAPTLEQLVGSATGLQSSFGQTSASGTTLLNVTDGMTVRLVFGGRNYDSARFLRGTLTLNYRDVVETVPLPPSAWLLGAAIAGVALRRRRQKQPD